MTKGYSRFKFIFSDVSRVIIERCCRITIIWQSLPIISKILILIRWTIMIPFLLALIFSILLTLLFFIPALFLILRWFAILWTFDFNTGDMKIPTFYSPRNENDIGVVFIILIPIGGVIFGGIHCAGWFFNFPSSDEAMLWRVSSVVLTGTALLLPLLAILLGLVKSLSLSESFPCARVFIRRVIMIIFLVYVVSRLLLLVEAFISLRHLTPGMLALVKWTSFIPHI